jgi:hypothetical protein
LARFEFESGTVLFYFSFIFVSFRESRLLVSWCAGGRCGMTCSDEEHSRSRKPAVEDQRWSHMSGTRWSGDVSMYIDRYIYLLWYTHGSDPN